MNEQLQDASQNQIYHLQFSDKKHNDEPKPTSIIIEYHNSWWIENICMIAFFGSCTVGIIIISLYYI